MSRISTEHMAKRALLGLIVLATAGEISSAASLQDALGTMPILTREVAASREAKTRCTPVATAADLYGIRSNLAGNYCLTNDIDAGVISNFEPIEKPFVGVLNGRGHSIRNLRIDVSDSRSLVGLFSRLGDGAVVERLRLVDVNITANSQSQYVGALAGQTDQSALIARVSVTGSVSGGQNTGGLVGYNIGSTISLSSAKVLVDGDDNAAGLVAQNKGHIDGCNAAGTISGIVSGGLTALNLGERNDGRILLQG